MSLWASVVLISLVWLAVGLVIAIAFGKLLKTSRELLEEDSVRRVSKAVTGFLNQEKDDTIVMYRDRESGKIESEEVMDRYQPCIVCLEYGYADDEDPRPPLATIRDQYIPLCPSHKRFVTQCLEEGIVLDDGDDAPSG